MKQRLTHARQKALAKLQQKKHRDAAGLFLVSGLRAVSGVLALSPGHHVQEVIIREDQEHRLNTAPFNTLDDVTIYVTDDAGFRAISDERHPQGIALVMRKPQSISFPDAPLPGITYYLYEINDPGNLGTIIRTAAWFGVQHILLSPNSVDPYSPKCVRATAGAIFKVRIWEDVSAEYLTAVRNAGHTIWASDVRDGQALSSLKIEPGALVLMGSEAHGLPEDIRALATSAIHIPGPGEGESLNLATATAIIMYHFRSQENK